MAPVFSCPPAPTKRNDMITSIKEFFSQLIEPGVRPDAVGGERALQLATAALLMEMIRMDFQVTDAEREAVAAVLRREFGISAADAGELMRLAAAEARQASGYHQFTSLINKSCDLAQRVHIVENLWQVAMADGHLDAHESHLMRKIADLLYIPHAEYIAAKQRARAAAGLPA